MPPLPTFRRSQTRTGTKAIPSKAPLPRRAAYTAEGAIGRGLESLGRGVGDLGQSWFQIEQMNNRSKDLIAESRFKQAIEKAELEYKTLTENDGDTKNWEGYRKQSIESFAAESNALDWGTSRTKQLADTMAQSWVNVFTKESLLGIVAKNNDEAITVTRVQMVNSLASLDEDPVSTELTGRAIQAHREALSTKYGEEAVDLLTNEARIDGLKDKAINLAAVGKFEEARKLADSIALLPPRERKALLSSINSMEVHAKKSVKELIEAQKSEANKQLTDLMASDKLTIDAIQSYRDILDDTDYKNWIKIALVPYDKKSNPVDFASIYGDALDIWRGAISKADFDRKLRGSLASPGGINKDDYKSLMQTAEQTLKTSQAEALSRADLEAGRLIVDFRDEDALAKFIADGVKGLEPDAASLFKSEVNEKRKLQFWYLSKYNQELRDWITKNPDKIGKDFYQYSEQLKHEYWNTSIEQIKEKVKKLQTVYPKVNPEMLEAARKVLGGELPQPKTEAEYNALEAGTEYIAPDGSRRIKK
jgi:hypothetical protein